MLKRDAWDKLRRAKGAMKEDYRKSMRQSSRNPRPGLYHRKLAAKVEAKRQRSVQGELRILAITLKHGVQFCEGFSKWFEENVIDVSRLQNAIRSCIGSCLRETDPISALEHNVCGQFLRFNNEFTEVVRLFPGTTIGKMPAQFSQWLLKFSRDGTDPTQARRARSHAARFAAWRASGSAGTTHEDCVIAKFTANQEDNTVSRPADSHTTDS